MFLTFLNWFNDLFANAGKGLLEDITDTSAFDRTIDALSVSTYAGVLDSVAFSIINNVMISVGLALTVTYFIISLVQLASRDNTTLEHYVKEFIKLIIAVTIVSESWKIILYMLQIGESVISALRGEVSTSSLLNNTAGVLLCGTLHEAEWFLMMLLLLVPWLIAKIASLAALVSVYLRAFDIVWRTIFFPVGVSNLFEGGPHAPGLRYAKSYFGSILSGAVTIIIICILPQLMIGALVKGANINTSMWNQAMQKAEDLVNTTHTALDINSAQAIWNSFGFNRGTNQLISGTISMVAVQVAAIGAIFGAQNKIKEIFS